MSLQKSIEEIELIRESALLVSKTLGLLAKEIKRLEKQMQQMSRDLKFEEAAKTRDKVLELKAHLI